MRRVVPSESVIDRTGTLRRKQRRPVLSATFYEEASGRIVHAPEIIDTDTCKLDRWPICPVSCACSPASLTTSLSVRLSSHPR